MSIRIKWDNIIAKTIPVEGGTKQGGISSPHVFNLFYEEMVKQLNSMDCGIKIGNRNYSTFCCSDDLLICSLIVYGLQNMKSVTYNLMVLDLTQEKRQIHLGQYLIGINL